MGKPTETVEAFRIDRSYYVRHYFDEDAYDVLRPFYQPTYHRFAVPVPAMQRLARSLRRRGYRLRLRRQLAPFVVVVECYAAHPQVIFSRKVFEWRRDGHHLFVLNSVDAVETAVRAGATPLSEAPVDLPEQQSRRPPGEASDASSPVGGLSAMEP